MAQLSDRRAFGIQRWSYLEGIRGSRFGAFLLTFVSVRTVRPGRYRVLMALLAVVALVGIHNASPWVQLVGAVAMLAGGVMVVRLLRLDFTAGYHQTRLTGEMLVTAAIFVIWMILFVYLPFPL